ncbi:similar to Saccharomyces cerevisiae YDR367W KEI1 Component of inositol phosphorylceramide (IPC) synthase [Maudiozyma barnettii]|uniref:Similar to Saccharomyces cerevisiae YDR367W KEI1 Component of inositol phosphorylceramide (IPC) synthase n=1 Tax=Maudiozyma barnettii TaxID=61262 RepID=A0A8H2VDY1_9SACH|nr:Kei1p [Kazachstania barnettii]CAB4253756.1 similar to Saccharomyces cerevisiae YDR367W KEI1 Component of inositol phosphorylceramide (IPC) synthase [Kazachstania barnettii]CAD1781504.1 similar to Saccharomyces cerevisiae YDR367W KEI1 Component of inositol phosphorylceramide (IPC) synthase [Kazachstania barnettii]
MRASAFRFPKTFLGFLPLYIAVEIVLGITILNKCSGAYGILAIFTGHPLDFMQGVSYLWSIFTLIVFAQGLYEIRKPTLLTFSQIFVFYSIDTVCTCFFTLWFTRVWFGVESSESANASDANVAGSGYSKRGADIASQGASQAYEYAITMLITWVSLIFRLYFNFILASFVKELLSNPKFMIDQDDVAQDLKNKMFYKRWWVKLQKNSYKLCRRLLV